MQSISALDNLVFYFMNATAFIEILDEAFPAELAIAKFSLKRGIIDEFHILINPGELPIGSAFEAKDFSMRYHRLPLPPKCKPEPKCKTEKFYEPVMEKDYEIVLEKMMMFLAPMEKLPIFFTEGNVRHDAMRWRKTRKILEKIILQSGKAEDLMDDIKVYPMDELFFALQRHLNPKHTGTIVHASHELTKDPFEWATKGCQFHEIEDASNNCCLSKVRRAAYSISSLCSKKDMLIEGSHYPKRN